jgi:RNA polymerase sigma-70 factor (ECF subfamily)
MTAREDERELLAGTAKGDEHAFTTLYRRHHQSIYRFAYLMTGAPAAADDVTQEVFLVLMREAHRIDPDRGPLIAFLQGVARNHVLRYLRQNQRYIALDHELVDSNPDRRVEASLVRRAVLALPARYREAVILCDFEGLKQEEAARVLGVPPGTIASRLHRAHGILARRLTPCA